MVCPVRGSGGGDHVLLFVLGHVNYDFNKFDKVSPTSENYLRIAEELKTLMD